MKISVGDFIQSGRFLVRLFSFIIMVLSISSFPSPARSIYCWLEYVVLLLVF